MGIVPFNLEVGMYAFLSLQSYLLVRASKMTLAQAIESGYVYVVPKHEVCVTRVDGVNICFCTIPF